MNDPALINAALALHQTGASNDIVASLTKLPPARTRALLEHCPLRPPQPHGTLLPRAKIVAYTEQFHRFYDATDPSRLVCERFLEAVHHFCLTNGYAQQSVINELYAMFRDRQTSAAPDTAVTGGRHPLTAPTHPVY